MKSNHLELAVGTGTLFIMILKWREFFGQHKCQIMVFDCAPLMLAGAARRFRKNKQVHLELGDVTPLQFADDSFDSAKIANAIHCFLDFSSGLAEVHRVLKKSGTLAGNVLLYPRGRGRLDCIAQVINILRNQKRNSLFTLQAGRRGALFLRTRF